MQANSTNWDKLPWEVVRTGVKRKVFTGEGATMVLNLLDPGHEPRPHSHVHEQMVYIVKGECEFHVGTAVFNLTEGGLLYIPPNVEHYAVVRGKEQVIDLDVFAPKRADYIK